MNRQPAISIVMGVYNAAETLDQAIESLLNQTVTDWELVACDDASTDGSLGRLTDWSKRDSRIRVIRNEQNLQLAATLNRCLSHARGRFIARMDADDLSAPERLETQLGFLQTNPQVDLVGTAMRRFHDCGVGSVVSLTERPTQKSLRSGVPFCHATILARASVFRELQGYTVASWTRRTEDLDLWFRFFDAGLVGRNLDEALYWVREDDAALRRRDMQTRLNVVRTSWRGFRLLDAPVHWYVFPLASVAKGLMPAWALRRLRQRASGDSVACRTAIP